MVVVSAPRRTDAGRERVALNTTYVAALARAGLVPLVVPPSLAPEAAAAAVDVTAGVVLTGGEDVDPVRYGAPPHPRLEAVDPARDAVELALIRRAGELRRPLLGICRGIQVLNVALGGTLYQDLTAERPGTVAHQDKTARHAIRIEPDTLLHRVLGAASASVNSRHHQAVRDIAPGLCPSAWSADGVVEALELPGGASADRWLLAVQWHPEDLAETALLDAFARAVG